MALLLVLLLNTAYLGVSQSFQFSQTIQNAIAFDNYKTQFKKIYASSEETLRKLNFLDNKKKVESHNSDPKQTYRLQLNFFADLSQEEFAKIYLTLQPPLNQLYQVQ